MLVNSVNRKAARFQAASVALVLAIIGSGCGATAAQQSLVGAGGAAVESTASIGQAQASAGSFSLDYDTAGHMGRLEAGAGATSLDYDTARHMGRSGASVTAP